MKLHDKVVAGEWCVLLCEEPIKCAKDSTPHIANACFNLDRKEPFRTGMVGEEVDRERRVPGLNKASIYLEEPTSKGQW